MLACFLLALLPWACFYRKFCFDTGRTSATIPPMPERECTERPPDRPIMELASAARWLTTKAPFSVNCLTLALAAKPIARWLGYHAYIRIGVKIEDSGQFASHAWLLHQQHPITGGRADQSYKAIWQSK